MIEKEQILNILDEVLEFYKREKIIMEFDRYYFGISFINKPDDKGIKYIIRM